MANFDSFTSTITNKRRFIETLLVIEDKQRNRVPFLLNPIQVNVHETETGRDIYVKPAQVGFSSERLASRLIDTITMPGTNTVLIAFEEFITQRLLDKAQFFYNVLDSLSIPGFPKMNHRSSYEKTFPDIHSSMYISSARSFVAGRAEIIHHLLADEFAFWEPGATERILLPALERIPDGGTADIFSTPNGEGNDFHDMYWLAKEGKSVFKSHFYPWFMQPEYIMYNDHPRCMSNCRDEEFNLTPDEELLMDHHGLSYDQIRWRRYKIFEMESLRRDGETRRLFAQEYPEDDMSCFLASGDMFYDTELVNSLAKQCYPAQYHYDHADVWFPPEPNRYYIVAVDPGQAKITQSAVVVMAFNEDSNPIYCARAAGLWGLEATASIARELGRYYNNAVVTWEANSHGLGLAPLLKDYPNLYYRRDIVSGRESSELGWLTTPKTKDFMFNTMSRKLNTIEVYDSSFISECRNIRLIGDKIRSVGADDIHDAVCIGLMCCDTRPVHRGFVGTAGYRW